MKVYIKLIVLAMVLPLFSFGQSEASNWYFGEGAGLQFNGNGSVTAVTDGRLNTKEGCATISDSDGNLLFYTDGITVFTSSHTVMQNGTGLYGDSSSTQSALIVPNQKDTNIFYIFTVDTSVGRDDPDYGLNYSTVDISLNAGAGAVTQKNINLLAKSSEKITAVLKDCFEKSVWIIAYGSANDSDEAFDTFYSFEVNDTGVVATPVVNTFDAVITDRRGYLKLSADGTKMAAANVGNGLYLYDFNASTGVLTNEQRIDIRATNKDPYGLEFSPNNQLLYVVTYKAEKEASDDVESSNLLQFNLMAGDISASQIVLDERNIYRGALQLAENGKIYRSLAVSYDQGSQYLGAINNPNQIGTAANYQHNAVYLAGKYATQGLPPFIQSFFAKTGLVKNRDGTTSTSLTVCEASSFVLETEEMPGATYNWSHNGIPFSNPNGHVLTITQAALTDEGKYTLEVIPADPSECAIIGEAQLIINEIPIANNTTLTQCDLDVGSITASTDGRTGFNLEQANFDISNGVAENNVTFYATEADRDTDTPIANPVGFINTANNQTIYTRVTNTLGCSSYGELYLDVQPTTASIGLPTNQEYYACDWDATDNNESGYFDLNAIVLTDYAGLEVAFYTSTQDAALELNAVSGANYLSETATLYVRLEVFNQCQGVSEITLNVQAAPVVEIEADYYLCTDNPNLMISAANGYDIYEWYKIETDGTEALVSSTIDALIPEIGTYRLELGYSYNGGLQSCTNSKTFKVTPSNIAQITTVEIKDIRDNNAITVLVSGDGDYEYALNNSMGPYQDSNVFTGLPIGFVDVYVRDKKGCGITPPYKVSIIGYPKMFTPNGDATNETWQISGLNEQFQPNSAIFIFDRYGVLLTKITPTSAGWDGTHNGQPLPESDYWFRAKLEDGRDFNGHFSLKR